MTCNDLRKIIPRLTLGAALVLGCAPANASSITYNLIGAATSGGTVTGTVSINSSTGLVTAAEITFNDSAVGNPVFTSIGSPNVYNNLGQDYISGPSDSSLNYGGQIALYYDLTNLAGGGDLTICLNVGPCGTESNQASFVQVYASSGNGGPFELTGGSLDPAGSPGPFSRSFQPALSSATPEPSSLMLLGTGMAACAFVVARFGRSKTRGEVKD